MFTTNVTRKTPQKKCYQEEKEREGGYVGNIYISFTIYCFHIVIKLHATNENHLQNSIDSKISEVKS
jgi:hypothetical protein